VTLNCRDRGTGGTQIFFGAKTNQIKLLLSVFQRSLPTVSQATMAHTSETISAVKISQCSKVMWLPEIVASDQTRIAPLAFRGNAAKPHNRDPQQAR
jgi:hypothetical protein